MYSGGWISHPQASNSSQRAPELDGTLVLVLICHCKPLQRIITCAVVPFNVFFSGDNSCRIEPHVLKDFPFELGDVSVSLFTVQLRCAFVFLRTFLLVLEYFICQLIFVWTLQHENRSPDTRTSAWIAGDVVRLLMVLHTRSFCWNVSKVKLFGW